MSGSRYPVSLWLALSWLSLSIGELLPFVFYGKAWPSWWTLNYALWTLGMSLAAGVLFAIDKRAAQRNAKRIPEKTPENVEVARGFKNARKTGEEVAGLNDWNIRWVGPEGYKGIVARQLQDFKKQQREREAANETTDKAADKVGE